MKNQKKSRIPKKYEDFSNKQMMCKMSSILCKQGTQQTFLTILAEALRRNRSGAPNIRMTHFF